jgi:hypothetical protein
VPADLVRQWRINRDNTALLAQFDCQKTADGMISCGGWQGVYCSGFHRYLLCCWWWVETEDINTPRPSRLHRIYFICSIPLDIDRLANGVPGHWGVESVPQLHPRRRFTMN